MTNIKKHASNHTPLDTIPLTNAATKFLIGLVGVLILALVMVPSKAEDAMSGSGYAEEGTNACLECHDETEDYPVLSIFHTAHGVIADERTPLGDKGCESCHGPNAEHVDRPRSEPTISFGPEYTSPVEVRTRACMSCHEGSARMHWTEGTHELEELSCNNCHRIHVQRDPMLDRKQQARLCFTCHKTQQAQVNLPSRHPIKEGQTVCSDCHNPHGSSTVADLKEPSLLEACVSCHKEKRGPFIFEHPPAAEDCSECHQPHGSAQPALLVSRPPFLCQQCHLAAFHPSQLADGSGLATGLAPNRNLLGKSCLNCHSKIHGSNHPSGARLTR